MCVQVCVPCGRRRRFCPYCRCRGYRCQCRRRLYGAEEMTILSMVIPAGCSDLPRWHAVGEGDESRRDALPSGSAGCRRRGPRGCCRRRRGRQCQALHRACSSKYWQPPAAATLLRRQRRRPGPQVPFPVKSQPQALHGATAPQ